MSKCYIVMGYGLLRLGDEDETEEFETPVKVFLSEKEASDHVLYLTEKAGHLAGMADAVYEIAGSDFQQLEILSHKSGFSDFRKEYLELAKLPKGVQENTIHFWVVESDFQSVSETV